VALAENSLALLAGIGGPCHNWYYQIESEQQYGIRHNQQRQYW
jgi:hypothetical protein